MPCGQSQRTFIRDTHTIDYSKFSDVEIWLTSPECRY